MEVNGKDVGRWNWATPHEIEKTAKASLLITFSSGIEILVSGLDYFNRDYDILVEPLGSKKTLHLQHIKSFDVMLALNLL